MSEETLNEPGMPAGFWRRMIAFSLDGLVLGALGLGLGLVMSDQFVAWGAWGRLFGFCIAAAYFGTLNSRLGNGQTLGKRALRLQVVDRDGALLSVPRALLRFLPLGLCWFLNNLNGAAVEMSLLGMSVLSILILGIGFCLLYLLIFNRPSRQTLHDLLVGSYVRTVDESLPTAWRPVAKVHGVVCALFVVMASLAPWLIGPLANSAPFGGLLAIQQAVSAETWVNYVQVYAGETRMLSTQAGNHSTTSLQLRAVLNDADINNAGRAQKLARLALAADASMATRDVVRITLVHGYDIGIASAWQSRNFDHSPAEWLAQP